MLEVTQYSGFGIEQTGLLNYRGVQFSSGNYATRGAGLTGLSDGSAFTLSYWIKAASSYSGRLLVSSSALFDLQGAGGTIYPPGWVGGPETISWGVSGLTLNQWNHVCVSYNGTAGSISAFVNDTSALSFSGGAGGTGAFSDTNYGLGATTGGILNLTASVSELWFHPSYIDLSNSANRRLFIDPLLRPADLGANGSRPLGGTQPILYLSVRSGQTLTDFLTNKGSGGNFTATGTPTVTTDGPGS
jgi:hypothetical protein